MDNKIIEIYKITVNQFKELISINPFLFILDKDNIIISSVKYAHVNTKFKLDTTYKHFKKNRLKLIKLENI